MYVIATFQYAIVGQSHVVIIFTSYDLLVVSSGRRYALYSGVFQAVNKVYDILMFVDVGGCRLYTKAKGFVSVFRKHYNTVRGEGSA